MTAYRYEGIDYPIEILHWIQARSDIADDMPDGAWEAMCKEGAMDYNEEYGTHYDEHESWLAWLHWQDQERSAAK